MARAPSTKGIVSISNVTPTMLLMKKYGSGFSRMVRDDVGTDVTPMVARMITANAMTSTKQGAAVAGTFKPVRDRFPAVRGFGATKVTSSGKPAAGDIGFGANWGGGNKYRTYATRSSLGNRYTVTRRTARQFGPSTGGSDRFIYSTIAAHQLQIEEAWQGSLDDCYKEWNRR